MPSNDLEEGKVTLVCTKHGKIGVIESKYIGSAEIDHRDEFGCEADFTIIPVVAAIVETIDEKKSE